METRLQIEAQQRGLDTLLDEADALLEGESLEGLDAVEGMVGALTEAQANLGETWDTYNDMLQEALFIQEYLRDTQEVRESPPPPCPP